MSKNYIYILLCFLFVSATANAQRVKVSGTVSDFDNKPVGGVIVAQKGTINATFTNSNGLYQLTVPAGDSIVIEFKLMSYQTAERTISVPEGRKEIVLNIMLRENATELDQAVVVGEKAQTGTMTKIDAGKTKLLADPTGGSIETLISAEASVSKTNELSNQYSVRGGSYDENIVYINGVEVYRPLLIRSGQQEGLSVINPNMTESVGFSSGGFDAAYGDKMASVLDITYKKPTEFEASTSASMLGASAYVGSVTKKFTQITGIRYKTTKSLLGTMDTDAEYDPTFIDLQTFMTFELFPKWEINFLGNFQSNDFKFTPITRRTNFGTMTEARSFLVYFDGWEHDKFLTSFGAFTLKGSVNDKLNIGIQASAFSSYERERYDINGEYELTDSNLESEGGEGEAGNMLGIGTYHDYARNRLSSDVMNLSHFGSLKLDNHLVKWGMSFQKEKIEDKIREWEMRDSAGYSLPNTGEIVSVYSSLVSDNSTNTTRISGYLQDTYRFNRNGNLFTLTAGVRGSYWSFNKEFIFSPRVSLGFIPAGEKGLTFRFATGIYYQAPFYKEYQKAVDKSGTTVIELNKDIKSQKSIHFVAGGDYKFKAIGDRNFKLTSEIYYKKLSDLVPYTVDNVKIRYSGENSASGYVTGIEAKLFGEFVPGTDSWISFAILKAQQKINGVSAPLPTDQRYNLSLYFQDYLPGRERLKMSLMAHLSQGLPTTAPHTGYDSNVFRMPSYKRVDLGFSWELLGEDYSIRNRSSFVGAFKNIWLGVDLFNLFDIKNTNSYYWITDIFNTQYAVPNYLTGRQINFKIVADF
ncbi:TonB-dependent receptor [Dysgonomonas sp. 216]|uniref:TonB-dependent receptor n=1 Tax=Dysgonomonas sp. 216 TaxID=2302934 RepID=UPI0013D1ACA1|nr:TonB-dependent receptor [Dysgonomonas sp. 216]NDW18001.1 TonB-dependent receptor [Dysgonomonas sp. 216]